MPAGVLGSRNINPTEVEKARAPGHPNRARPTEAGRVDRGGRGESRGRARRRRRARRTALARPPDAGKDPSPVVAAATAPGGSAEIVKIHHRIRDLPARLRRALGSPGHRVYHLELEGPILIRYSGVGDEAALERLAALDSRTLPE